MCWQSLPDNASLEDVQYSIYVRERIERGRREAGEGKLLDQDEVKNRMFSLHSGGKALRYGDHAEGSR